MIGDSEDFWMSPEGVACLEDINEQIRQFWAQNIYRIYNRHSGQLGNACLVQYSDGCIRVQMTPILDPETGVDYGRDLRRGIPAGPGEYDPERRVRVKKGMYPGVPVTKFWIPWLRILKPAVMEIVRMNVYPAYRQYCRRQIREVL